MTEYPAQSHASREPKQIQAVTTSEARVRKAPFGRRLRDNFVQDSAPNVWGTMLWEVLLPGARDVIANGFHEGIDMVFQGTRTNYRRTMGGSTGISRSQISKHNPDRALGGRPDTRYVAETGDRHDTTVFEIDSRVEAEEVLSQMNDLIDQFDVCTFADYLVMMQKTPGHTDYKFGWEDLGGSKVISSRGAFYLDLPRPIQLK